MLLNGPLRPSYSALPPFRGVGGTFHQQKTEPKMTVLSCSTHPAIRKAYKAAQAFAPSPYYARVLLDRAYIEARSRQFLEPIEENIAERYEMEAGVLEILKHTNAREIRRGKKIVATEKAIDDQMNKVSFYEQALSIIETTRKNAYREGALYALERFEKAEGFSKPECVRNGYREIKIMLNRADLSAWPRKERREIMARLKRATRAAHEQSEALAFISLAKMDAPCITIQDIETAGRRAFFHARATGLLSRERLAEKQKDINEAMCEAAARCFKTSLITYEEAPRFWDASDETRRQEETRIHSFILYAQKAKDMQKVNLSDRLRNARSKSLKNAATAQMERAKEQAAEGLIERTLPQPVARKEKPLILAAG